MAKIIGFGRCLGKTTMAILESHATGHYIVCPNSRRAKYTFDFAEQLGYTIPYPLTIESLRDSQKPPAEPVIVDDVEKALELVLGCPIDTITFNSPNVQPVEDRYAEEIAELKKEVNACYREKAEDQNTIESLKDKCVNLMLENADYVWDEMARSDMAKRANTRRWRSRGCI